jgi:hypothetical protein
MTDGSMHMSQPLLKVITPESSYAVLHKQLKMLKQHNSTLEVSINNTTKKLASIRSTTMIFLRETLVNLYRKSENNKTCDRTHNNIIRLF